MMRAAWVRQIGGARWLSAQELTGRGAIGFSELGLAWSRCALVAWVVAESIVRSPMALSRGGVRSIDLPGRRG